MAVTWWFLARLGLLDGARQLAPNPHHYRLDVLLKDPDYRNSVATCDPTELSWLRILRDPYNRSVSSYRHVLRHGFDDVEIEQKINVTITDSGLSFAEFLAFLESIDIAKCNVHYRQQWHPLEEHVAIRRLVNIDQENLLEGLDAFESDLGLAPLLPDTRASLLAALNTESVRHHTSRETGVGNHFAIRMTRDEANGHWPTYDAFLSGDARRALERIYARDFAAYAKIF
jgi:hypothetical protein